MVDLRQFKLTNEEEIICEVVEWNDDEHDTMVVKRALKIVALDDAEGSMRYYTFKPWMMMNNDPESLQVLNSYHIVSECHPTKVATSYYYDVIREMKEFESEYEPLEMSFADSDEVADKILVH